MNAIREANLELLIGLKKHLDQAEELRGLLDRLLILAKTELSGQVTQTEQRQESKTPMPRER
jgi:hypothetical protein